MQTKITEKRKKQRTENILAIVSVLILIIAFVIGFNRNLTDIEPFLKELVPMAESFEQSDYEQYKALDAEGNTVAYITVDEYNGFGGPLKMARGVDLDGKIVGVKIAEHVETPSWHKKVINSPLLPSLIGKSYMDDFKLGDDVDAIIGATYTARAITQSVKSGSRELAVHELNMEAPIETHPKLKFGIPEITLIVLLLVGLLGIKKASSKNKKIIRWMTLITGMIVLGFWYNHPLNLVDINKLLMGYFPDIYNQLYWYLLVFGVFLIFLTTNKNIYCAHVCPFGAAQDCAALVAKAKNVKKNQFSGFLKWTRRVFVLAAVVIALIMRNPGFTSYEVFGTFFTLSGSNLAVLFLGIVLVLALFLKRPWCNFLCPIPAFEDLLRVFMRWGKNVFKIKKRV